MEDENKSNFNTSVNDWTLPMINKFIKTLMDLTLCSDVKELKNHQIPKFIWDEMEGWLNKNSESLKNIWYFQLHMQLFCSQPIHLNDIKIKLIEYMYEKGIRSIKDIKWHNVVLYFDGMTNLFLSKIMRNMLYIAKNKLESTEFEAQITYLRLHYIPYLLKCAEDRLLPRLRYENDKLVHIETDVDGKIL